MHHVSIIYTTDLTETFEQAVGRAIGPDDQLELYKQLFQILDDHSPEEMVDRDVLALENFVFANHLTVNGPHLNAVAQQILVQVWQRISTQNFYVDGVLMYFPFSMHGPDLCVRRYNS